MRYTTSLKGISVAGAAVCFSLALSFGIMAWTEPQFAPPAGNTAVPLNTSINPQIKAGNLKIGGGLWITNKDTAFALKNSSGAINFVIGDDGALGILEGGANPSKYSFFRGADQAADIIYTLPASLPASNKILQSNAAGVLSWVDAAAASQWISSGSSIYYNSGNVGIGVIAPEEKLDISGAAQIRPLGAAPSQTANKLYNIGGDLYWNGVKLNGGAAPGASGAGAIRQTISKNAITNTSTNSSSWRDISDLTTTITASGAADLFVLWNMSVTCQGSANMAMLRVLVDGSQVGGTYNFSSGSYVYAQSDAISVDAMSGHGVVGVASGTHIVKLQWKFLNAGNFFGGKCYIYPKPTGVTDINGTPYVYGGTMTVMEIAR